MTELEYTSLIILKLTGEISIEQDNALQAWTDTDVEHKNIFNSFQKDWIKAETYKSSLAIDKSTAWQNIENQIKDKKETKVISISSKRQWMKYVALVVVLFTVSLFVKDFVLNKGFVIEKTAKNETRTILLPDGSEVVLNENSCIKYNETFAQREVSLKGEAFFDVVKNEALPFSVKANSTITHVLGTSFNIDADKKGNVELALITGKVKFSNKKNNSLIINPGEIALYDNRTSMFSLNKVANANSIAWKTKKLVFDNTNLSEVISNLNDYYQVEIDMASNSEETNCNFTGTFDNAEINEVLDVICFSLNTKYHYSNDVYRIGELTCE